MFRLMKKLIFIPLGFQLFVNLAYAQITSQQPFCLPSCSSVDGRFLVIGEGDALQTFTPGVLNVQIIVPAGSQHFRIGLFDGDAGGGPASFWDGGEQANFSYNVIIDPDQDNMGATVLQAFGEELPDDDWADFLINTHPDAMNANGNFGYTLEIKLLDETLSLLNAFKVRSSALLQIDEPFSLASIISNGQDASVVYPNFEPGNGISAEDYSVSNYDGTFSLFFSVPDDVDELTLWDADLDHGNQDGTDFDTDDLNTPNDQLPPFVTIDSDILNEGLNQASPFDDQIVNGESDPLNLLVFPPAVTYTVIFPDGRQFKNFNPSGNREWEQLVISTTQSDPALVDYATDEQIPAGLYELRIEGLDMQNLAAFSLPFPMLANPEKRLLPAEVPVLSLWGLLVMMGLFSGIGFVVYQRR